MSTYKKKKLVNICNGKKNNRYTYNYVLYFRLFFFFSNLTKTSFFPSSNLPFQLFSINYFIMVSTTTRIYKLSAPSKHPKRQTLKAVNNKYPSSPISEIS